jgi:hypothetical protein
MRAPLRMAPVLVGLVAAFAVAGRAAAAPGCHAPWAGACGVHSNPAAGTFHGLIAVDDEPWVLVIAGQRGTQPGCADCEWSVVLACATTAPDDPGTQRACTAASRSPVCRRGELLYRLYLTTAALADALEGTLCLGGGHQVIPLGDNAAGDVARYLRDVSPPDLTLLTRPAGATLAGLATYFSAALPGGLRPATLGGRGIRETITLTPTRTRWRWGDGSVPTLRPAPGEVTHTYRHGGAASIRLTTRWGATYTISYQGRTFGPYQAVGRLVEQQSLRLPVLVSVPVLVSR